MRSIDSKYGLTYIMGDEISICETLKEFGTYYKSKMNERQVQIAEDLRKREIIKLVKLKDGQTGYKLYALTKRTDLKIKLQDIQVVLFPLDNYEVIDNGDTYDIVNLKNNDIVCENIHQTLLQILYCGFEYRRRIKYFNC